MSDTFSNLPSLFFAGDTKNVPQALRQRIALAMLAKNRAAAPKNFGEGLSAIGEAIGERSIMRQLEAEAAAAEAAGTSARNSLQTPTGAPAPATPVAFAPSDTDVNAPAVSAVNSLAAGTPSETIQTQHPDLAASPGLTATPPGNMSPSMFSPAGPRGLGGTPASSAGSMNMLEPRPMVAPPPPPGPAAQASPEDGGYNMIDAQAGMRRMGQGRVQGPLERAYPGNPDMQAYGSQLAAGEQQVPGDTSSTGARGPWQFVPGTARQYGLSNPDDPNQAAMALKRFTADNAATFERINGRPPTMAELAVMHQQGGQTGANMVAGTGNATPRNLSLNNVPPGAGPAQAVDRIKGYYGLPDKPVDARDRIARVMAFGADPAEPPARPAPPAGSQMAFNGNGSSMPVPSGITAAPPAAPPIAAAPPVARAPAAAPAPPVGPPQAAVPGYVPTLGAEPTPPPTMTPTMQQIQRKIQDAPPAVRDSVREALTPMYNDETKKLEQQQLIYKDKLQQHHERLKQIEDMRGTAVGRIDTHAKEQEAITEARDKNRLRAQFGNMEPSEVYKRVDESHKAAKAGADALTASSAAMDAFSKGAITGFGADAKLNAAKLFTALGLTDKGNLISNTETFRSAMQPVVAAILHQTSGTSQLSEGELAFAKAAAAGNITLDAQSVQRLMSIIDKRSREVIKEHNTLTGALFGSDNPQTKALYGVEAPDVPYNFANEADAAAARLPRKSRVRINGRLGKID